MWVVRHAQGAEASRLAEDALDGLQVPLAVAPHQHHKVPGLVDAAAAGHLLLDHLQHHLPHTSNHRASDQPRHISSTRYAALTLG